MKNPYILAIDTSCDETSVAVNQGQKILSNVVASQINLHQQYGGVFPTVAKQAHQENIEPTITAALKKAQLKIEQIDYLAVTQGPGLAPALEIGIEKVIELGKKYHKPVLAVNHIEGHILSVLAQAKPTKKAFSSIQPQLPALSVVVSGGHTEFVLVKKIGEYKKLGTTLDDAAGECLDKVGRILGLGYPAGPTVELFAKKGDPKAFDFPLPMTTSNDFNMSFSGMKTHSRKMIEKLDQNNQLDKQTIINFCAGLQYGVFRHITYKLRKLLAQLEVKELWLGGGVAANTQLKAELRKVAQEFKLKFRTPYTKRLCGDNGAMIGVTGYYQVINQKTQPQKLDRKPHWDISEL